MPIIFLDEDGSRREISEEPFQESVNQLLSQLAPPDTKVGEYIRESYASDAVLRDLKQASIKEWRDPQGRVQKTYRDLVEQIAKIPFDGYLTEYDAWYEAYGKHEEMKQRMERGSGSKRKRDHRSDMVEVIVRKTDGSSKSSENMDSRVLVYQSSMRRSSPQHEIAIGRKLSSDERNDRSVAFDEKLTRNLRPAFTVSYSPKSQSSRITNDSEHDPKGRKRNDDVSRSFSG